MTYIGLSFKEYNTFIRLFRLPSILNYIIYFCNVLRLYLRALKTNLRLFAKTNQYYSKFDVLPISHETLGENYLDATSWNNDLF